MKQVLTHGSRWPLQPLNKENQIKDIKETFVFGNHNSAIQQQDLLRKLVTDDIVRGFALPLPLDKIVHIPRVLLAPLNIQAQNTINKWGKTTPKNQRTQDQSWKWQPGTSVNSRVDADKLMPCYFGQVMQRLINWAVAPWKLYPDKRILATKLNVKALYWQCHLNVVTAIPTCDMDPAPIQRSCIDDALARLWRSSLPFGMGIHPRIHLQSSHCNPTQQRLISQVSPLTSKAPCAKEDHFGKWHPFRNRTGPDSWHPSQPTRHSWSLHYINDLSVLVDIDNNAVHLKQAPLLAVGSAAQEVFQDKPLPRNDMEARLKLIAETGCTKWKTILGWLLDFCSTTIALPDNKFHAYLKTISKMMDRGWTLKGELEMNIGGWDRSYPSPTISSAGYILSSNEQRTGGKSQSMNNARTT